jgi:hypothetical protein
MGKNELLDSIKLGLNRVTLTMKNHKGVDFIMKSRLKFEKWFQVELLKELLIITEDIESIRLINEYPVSEKKSKKGETIDLAILGEKGKIAAIELKVVPTNYDVPGFKKSTKAITDAINEMIGDLAKSRSEGFQCCFSIGLIFPFPLDPDHRNNKSDFVKQESKLKEVGQVEILPCKISDGYSSWYYILHI